jgi:Galactose oxidase-like, Early set domain/Kelch motif
VRPATLFMCVLIGLAVPAAASAHARHDGAVPTAATSLRQVANECATYSPRAEARLRRAEAGALGGEHAAEHARSRAEARREACTPAGKVRPSYAARVRRAATAKHVHAVGPASAVGQWSGPIPMNGIIAIHATLMPNGKILFFYNNPSFGDEDAAKVMVWDPATRTGVRRDVPSNIWCAGQVLLADGRVLVVGGNLQYQAAPGTPGGSFKGLNEIWLFDPISETWTQGPNMRHGRWYPTATRLADGRVLITAGWDETGNGSSANNRDVELYTPAADGRGPGTVQVVGDNDLDYYPHQFVLPDGRVIIAGPRIDDTYYVNPAASFAFTQAPDLNVDRVFGFGAGVLLPGPPSGSSKVLLIGGATNGDANGSTATTEELDAANPGADWQFRAPLPESRRNVNGVILPDGNILAVGGNQEGASNGYRKETLLYSPVANGWTPMATQGEGRGYHSTALLLPDASVVSAGGDTDPVRGIVNDIAEVFSPPYLFRGPGPAITSVPASVGYGAQFAIGASGQVSRAVLMAPGATTHANDMNQRHVELAISPTAGGVLAAAPPSPNVAPPGPYMLFLVNAQGVPSAARWVWVGVPVPPGFSAGAGAGAVGGAGAGAAGAGAGAAGAQRISPPRVKRLRVRVVFTRGAATVRLVLATDSAFRGTLGLYPVRRGIGGRAIKRALVSKKVAGRGGRNVVLPARFSTSSKRFPLKLRLALRLKDPRGGADRIVSRSILLRRSPPSARFLG